MVLKYLTAFPEGYLKIMNSEGEVHFDFLWKVYNESNYEKNDKLINIYSIKSYGYYNYFSTQLKFYLIKYCNSEHYKGEQPDEVIYKWYYDVITEIDFPNDEKCDSWDKWMNAVLIKKKDNSVYKYFYPESEIRNYFHRWSLAQVTLDEWISYPTIEISNELKIVYESPLEYSSGIGELMKKLFMEQVEHLKESEIIPRLNVKLLADRERKILNRVFDNSLNNNDKNYLINNFKLFKDREINQVITECMLEDMQLENYDIHSSESYMQYFLLIEYYKLLNGEGTPANAECSFCYKHKDNLPQLLKDFFGHLVDLNLISAEKDAFMAAFSGEIPETKIAWNSNLDQLKLMVNYLDKELHLLDNSERKSQLKIIPTVFCKKDGSDFSTKSFNSIRPGSKIDAKLKAACDVLIPPNYKHLNL